MVSAMWAVAFLVYAQYKIRNEYITNLKIIQPEAVVGVDRGREGGRRRQIGAGESWCGPL